MSKPGEEAPLKRFRWGQRVRVIAQDGHPLREKLIGQRGRVVRVRTDGAAWVTMDIPLPDELASFPAADSRRNNIVMYPEECADTEA